MNVNTAGIDRSGTDSNESYDVVVAGGGPAGLSAAILLARFRWRVAVVDAGEPRNAPSRSAHNVFGSEGDSPAELNARARADFTAVDGELISDRVIDADDTGTGIRVECESGRSLNARRVLLATGLRDVLPDLPGIEARWGHDVIHCPYCHGWEVRGQRIGVLATSEGSAHQARLFSQLSDDVIVFQHTSPAWSAEQNADLAALGIDVVDGTVAALDIADDRLRALRLVDGRTVERDVLVVAPQTVVDDELFTAFGVQSLNGTYSTAPDGRVAARDVWLAGNARDPYATVLASAAQGMAAGAGINTDLIAVRVENARRHRATA